MKNIFRILSMVALVSVLTGCFDDPGTDVTLTTIFVSASQGTYELNEGARDTVLVEVSQAQTSDLVINYTITDSNTANGVDYNVTGTSVTIPAGQYSAEIPMEIVDNNQFEGVARSFTIAFETSVEVNGNSEVSVTLIDDDCLTPSIVGSFDVVTTGTSPAGCEGVENNITIALVSSNGDGTTTYSLTDVTGGLYPNCYNSADNPGEIVVAADGLAVTLTNQPDVVYGGDVFNGTGVIDACAETLTIMWSNGFGDAGTTVFAL